MNDFWSMLLELPEGLQVVSLPTYADTMDEATPGMKEHNGIPVPGCSTLKHIAVYPLFRKSWPSMELADYEAGRLKTTFKSLMNVTCEVHHSTVSRKRAPPFSLPPDQSLGRILTASLIYIGAQQYVVNQEPSFPRRALIISLYTMHGSQARREWRRALGDEAMAEFESICGRGP